MGSREDDAYWNEKYAGESCEFCGDCDSECNESEEDDCND